MPMATSLTQTCVLNTYSKYQNFTKDNTMMLLKLADSHVFMYKKVFSKTCIGCEMKIC